MINDVDWVLVTGYLLLVAGRSVADPGFRCSEGTDKNGIAGAHTLHVALSILRFRFQVFCRALQQPVTSNQQPATGFYPISIRSSQRVVYRLLNFSCFNFHFLPIPCDASFMVSRPYSSLILSTTLNNSRYLPRSTVSKIFN